ncbi:hypothetical protein FRB99_002164, partial [Tulasnella sp. 403]
MTPSLRDDIARVMDWFETEVSLWVAIITGSGRAFTTGMDLTAWTTNQASGRPDTNFSDAKTPGPGIGSISKRQSKKPILAAVNGYAIGGGLEMVLNCDIVVASKDAKFGYPEVTRGVGVLAGGIPRSVRVAGHQLAAELLLTGRLISAEEARDRFRFVNVVVPADDLLKTALDLAKNIASNSPDAVQCNKLGIVSALQIGGVDDATYHHVNRPETERMFGGSNILEGLRSFME